MKNKIKLFMFRISIISLFMIMSFAFVETVSAVETLSAYEYNTNILANRMPSSSSSSNGWVLNNCRYQDKEFKGNTDGVFTATYQFIKLSDNDQIRANDGLLTVSASAKFWCQSAAKMYSFLRVRFYDSNFKLLEIKQIDKIECSWDQVASLTNYAVRPDTVYIQYEIETRDTVAGFPPTAREISLSINDEAKPEYKSVIPSVSNITVPAGTVIRYSVKLSEPVNVVWKGTLKVSLGGAEYDAICKGQSEDKTTLYYDYDIPSSGSKVSNNTYVKVSKISSLTVCDDAGNLISIDQNPTDNFGIYVDNQYPSVDTFETETSGNTYFKEGEKITFNVTFDENITVSSLPYILLSNGGKATYSEGTDSDTKMVSFVYTVASSDTNTTQSTPLAIAGVDFTGIVDKVNQGATSSASYDVNKYNEFLDAYNIGIDTNAPTVSFTDPTSVLHDENYKTLVSPADNLSGIKELYSVWTTSSSDTAPTFPLDSNVSGNNEIINPTSSETYYLWIKATDNVGNSSSTKSPYTYNYDVTPPTIIITPSYISGYSAVAKVIVEVIDTKGVVSKSYVWKDSNNTTVANGDLSDEITYPDKDGIYSLIVTATDNVGHTTTQIKENISIDKVGPAVTFTPDGNSTWVKSKSVSVSVSDDKTGVLSYEYQWSTAVVAPTSGWTATSDTSFTTPSGKSGTYYLYIKALDNAGNIKTSVSGGFNIDNTPPTISITPNGNSGNLDNTEYEIGITVQDIITATDKLDKKYIFSTLENASELVFIDDITTETVTLSDYDETTYLYIQVIDEAGNSTLFKSQAFFTLDTIAPTGSITNESGDYIKLPSVNLSFTVNDNLVANSDIKMQLTIDGTEGEWELFSSSKPITFGEIEGNHTVFVKFKDKMGNVSTPYSTSFIYDKTPPIINIAYVPDEATNGSVIATATSIDVIDGESSHTFIENGTFAFNAYDKAGNTCQRNAEVTWIDKTNPIINFSSEEFDNKNHQSAKVILNCEDNANGIASVKYRIVHVVNDSTETGVWQNCTNGFEILLNGVADGTYYIEATTKDNVGNETNKSSGNIYIDMAKPVATIKYSPETRTANNVEAVITFNEMVTITNNNGNNTYSFADNGNFTFEFEDEAGNSSTEIACVTWIDLEKPKARIAITDENFNSVSENKWVNYNLLVTIAPPAQSTIDKLTFNGEVVSQITTGSSISSDIKDCGNNTYLVSTYGIFKYVVHDTDTFLESDGEITVRIDKNAPEYVSEIRTITDWTNKDVVVTITAKDDLTDVIYTEGNSYTFIKNKSHTFNFTDLAGNKNSYTVEVSNIDKDVPTANISYNIDGNSYNGEYTNKDITAKVNFDSLSPVVITNNGGSNTHTFISNGEFVFEFIDEAGNIGSKKVSIDKIDKKAPTVYVTYSSTKWINKDVIATLHVSDECSGVENEGETHTFIANGEYLFTAKDNAGNIATTTASAIRIDKTPPTLSYSLSPLGKTPYSVFATVSADESVTWLNNGGKPSMQFKSNGSFIFKAQDYAGNESEITVVVNNITKESTPIVLEYSTIEPTNEDVYATIYPEDKINDVIFIINNDNSKIRKFEQNGEFAFSYRNPAGIMGDAIASVSNINKTPPVVTVQYSTTELTKENVVVTLTADKEVIYPFVALNGKYTFTENDKVQIPVTDTIGNITYVLLEVNWIDKDAPKIILENQYEAISKGTEFSTNDGVSVIDASAISNGIIITGTVDTSIVGDYEIKYCATDIVGNTSEITKHVTVYDPNGFNVIINGKMPVNSEVEIIGNNMTLETINQIGNLKLLCVPGKKNFGYFKKNGDEIINNYTFVSKGYYTLYLQDENRNTKLVYVFVK